MTRTVLELLQVQGCPPCRSAVVQPRGVCRQADAQRWREVDKQRRGQGWDEAGCPSEGLPGLQPHSSSSGPSQSPCLTPVQAGSHAGAAPSWPTSAPLPQRASPGPGFRTASAGPGVMGSVCLDVLFHFQQLRHLEATVERDPRAKTIKTKRPSGHPAGAQNDSPTRRQRWPQDPAWESSRIWFHVCLRL